MTELAADLLPILIAPNPALKMRARPVGLGDDAQIRELLPRMFASMYRAPGIGLAAPQVEVGLRMAIIDLMKDEKSNPIVPHQSGTRPRQ